MNDNKTVLQGFTDQLEITRSVSPNTITSYLESCRSFGNFLADQGKNFLTADAEDFQAWINHRLNGPCTPRTVAKEVTGVKALYRYILVIHLIYRDPTLTIRVPAVRPHIRSMGRAAVEAMFEIKGFGALGLRDHALLAVLYGGPRVSEVLGIKLRDLDLDGRTAVVIGKGDIQRNIPITERAFAALTIYLREGRPTLICPSGDVSDDYLFISKGGCVLTRSRVWRIVKDRDPKAYPHMLRKSCVTHMVENGASPKDVQQVVGHKWEDSLGAYLDPMSAEAILLDHQKYHPRP